MSQASQKRAICILGMHRSGTSVITRCVNLLGISLGNPDRMLPPRFDNPDGFWEHADIVRLHDDILRFFSRRWDSTIPLPKYWNKVRGMNNYKKQIHKLIDQEFSSSNIWGWKDPRTCLLLPLWIEVLQERQTKLDIIFVIRNPHEVVTSLKRRDGFEHNQGYAIWTLYLLSALKHCEGLRCVFIHYERFLNDPLNQLRKISDKLELPWPQDEMGLSRKLQTIVKPSLRHSKMADEEFLNDFTIPLVVRDTYRLLLDFEKDPAKINEKEYSEVISNFYKEMYEYSSSCNEGENKVFISRVYIPVKGEYNESYSFGTASIGDGKLHQIEIPIQGRVKDFLRFDPTNIPASVQIKEIKLVHPESMLTYKEWNSRNLFSGLKVLNNIENLRIGEMYSFISTTEDPQLLLDGIAEEIENPLVLIVMKVVPLSSCMVSLIQSLLSQSNLREIEEKIDFLREKLQERTKLEEYFVDLLKNKEQQIQEIADELSAEKEKLRMLTQQLEHINKELTLAKEQVQKQNSIISSLEKEVKLKENEIISLYNSHGYKLLKKYYKIRDRFISVSFRKKIKNSISYIRNFLDIILRKRYFMRLIPMNDVYYDEGIKKWVSTGDDPQFFLEGEFPVGWIKLVVKCSFEKPTTVKLYWDNGGGMSETNAIRMSVRKEEHTELRRIFFLDERVKKLRLDPGAIPQKFCVEKVYFEKIGRLHALCYSIKLYLKKHGISISTMKLIFKKLMFLHNNGGISIIWEKIKNYVEVECKTDVSDQYQYWVIKNEITEGKRSLIRKEIEAFKYKPLISVLVPVYNVDEKWLRKCIESVRNQLYENWELCIADDASSKPHVRRVLEEYARKDRRIKVAYRNANGHISEASNTALELASGEFVALLDHDDELSIDALYENVKLLNQHPDADMIYSDEDKIDPDGNRHSPFFKPDWSPEMILGQMYTCHLGVYRTSLVREIGGFRKGYEGSQDHDLVLRLSEKTDRIYHIPKILYHWRSIPESTSSGEMAKPYSGEAGAKAVNDAIRRRNINAIVKRVPGFSNLYNIHYIPDGNPLISIIIPTKDMGEVLDKCLSSIFQKSTYCNFEVIIVDNGSKQKETFQVFDKWKKAKSEVFHIERIDIPFNYSKLNNMAVKKSRGEYILLLNNDTEIITPNWLEELVGQAQQKGIGAVGACLLYPDNTIQHGGVILGIYGIAGHSHRYFKADHPGYFSRLLITSNYSAVTGACLMVRREIYWEVGGMDENLAVAFNDVDFCLKIREKGYRNVWLPQVKLYHYESKTRGAEDTPEKLARFQKEIQFMKEKWGDKLFKDPFYNPNLTLDREDFSIKVE